MVRKEHEQDKKPKGTQPRRGNAWKYKPDPLLEELNDVKPSGPSIRSDSGSVSIADHIVRATKMNIPIRVKIYRRMKRFLTFTIPAVLLLLAYMIFVRAEGQSHSYKYDLQNPRDAVLYETDPFAQNLDEMYAPTIEFDDDSSTGTPRGIQPWNRWDGLNGNQAED